MYLTRGGVGGECGSGYDDRVWALPILWEHGELMGCVEVCLCLACGCVGGVGVELVGVGPGLEG